MRKLREQEAGPVSLCYHDVIAGGNPDASGFPGRDAATYKLDFALFRNHLDAIRQSGVRGIRLTFDDGGSSAHTCIAEELERRGLTGYFFITTDYIGRPGFLSAKEIGELHTRGHVIGSHGSSHRGRMSSLPFAKLTEEWKASCRILSGITEAPVTCGSVPSGFYAPRVATAAADAGIRELYTQEPTSRCEIVGGCRVRGRFTIRPWTDTRTVRALIQRDPFACMKARAWWEMKELSKGIGGRAYTRMRRSFFKLASAGARHT